MIYGHEPISGPRRPVGPPDFVVKLYQILQKEDPKLITWDSGRIIMLNPSQLASEVLPKYFRHSRFSSFQRQLNNFGFRKIEGKGKLVPCTYLRDDLEGQPSSALMSIRRKVSQTSRSRPESGSGSPIQYLGDVMPLATMASSSSSIHKFGLDDNMIPRDQKSPSGHMTMYPSLLQLEESSKRQRVHHLPTQALNRSIPSDALRVDVGHDHHRSSERISATTGASFWKETRGRSSPNPLRGNSNTVNSHATPGTTSAARTVMLRPDVTGEGVKRDRGVHPTTHFPSGGSTDVSTMVPQGTIPVEDVISTNDLIETLTLLDAGTLELGAHPHLTHVLEGQSHIGDASPCSRSTTSHRVALSTPSSQQTEACRGYRGGSRELINDPMTLVSRSRLFYANIAQTEDKARVLRDVRVKESLASLKSRPRKESADSVHAGAVDGLSISNPAQMTTSRGVSQSAERSASSLCGDAADAVLGTPYQNDVTRRTIDRVTSAEMSQPNSIFLRAENSLNQSASTESPQQNQPLQPDQWNTSTNHPPLENASAPPSVSGTRMDSPALQSLKDPFSNADHPAATSPMTRGAIHHNPSTSSTSNQYSPRGKHDHLISSISNQNPFAYPPIVQTGHGSFPRMTHQGFFTNGSARHPNDAEYDVMDRETGTVSRESQPCSRKDLSETVESKKLEPVRALEDSASPASKTELALPSAAAEDNKVISRFKLFGKEYDILLHA